LRDLEKSNKELEQFAYVASHDLQEPLRKMSTYLHLLEMEYKDKMDEKGTTYVNVAVKAGSQMRDLIQDLLEYSNIAAINENLGSTDMNQVVEKVTKTLALQIEESGAKIVSTHLPLLHQTNTSQMQQLMQNLLSNALKYRSDKKAHIKIYVEDLSEHWRFAIQDNGIGIQPECREKVFAVFQRLHSRSQYPGTGIGLSICKKIIEQYGGRIWVDSNAEGGCTFFFTIPKHLTTRDLRMQ
jgi:light-regulated signal transduction histidine kinase (bacteriophytochrome)